jgi:hypothetical protein
MGLGGRPGLADAVEVGGAQVIPLISVWAPPILSFSLPMSLAAVSRESVSTG